MKKKVGIVFISLVVIIGGAFSVDYKRIKSDKEPIFSKAIATYKDGGSTEYLGLGYKIIKYANFTENEEFEWDVDYGPWFMRFDNQRRLLNN